MMMMIMLKIDNSQLPQTLSSVETGENCLLNIIKGFEHKVAIKASARPVRQKLRRIPLAVQDDVKKEGENMLEEGIIERTQASE